jgi:hypothetical protein
MLAWNTETPIAATAGNRMATLIVALLESTPIPDPKIFGDSFKKAKEHLPKWDSGCRQAISTLVSYPQDYYVSGQLTKTERAARPNRTYRGAP